MQREYMITWSLYQHCNSLVDHRKYIWPEKKVPSMTHLTTESCSSLVLGNAGRADALGGASRAMASHSLHISPSLVSITVWRLGARSRIALINVSCCSRGLKWATWSSLNSMFFEAWKSRSHRGLVLSANIPDSSFSSPNSHACSHTYILH